MGEKCQECHLFSMQGHPELKYRQKGYEKCTLCGYTSMPEGSEILEVMEIVSFLEPVMCEPAKNLENLEGVKKLIGDMILTMERASGIGLAANQVGLPIRVFVMKTSYGPLGCINPKIVDSGGIMSLVEGCLSAPGHIRKMSRKGEVTLEFTNIKGERQTRTFLGLEAACVQHEMDHLDGITIVTK